MTANRRPSVLLYLSIPHGTVDGFHARLETAVRGYAPTAEWNVRSCSVIENPNLERRSYKAEQYVANVEVQVW